MSGFVFSRKPINITRGVGAYLVDDAGTEYLDVGASYGCAPVGHCHPAVVEAVQDQASQLMFVQGSYPTHPRAELFDTLPTLAPDGLDRIWLCNSGTEANEAALKFARSATEGDRIIAAKRAFHGRTMGTLSTTWKPKYRKPYEPLLEDVDFVPYGDAQALEAAIDDDVCAVILEPIQGEGGIREPPAGYLETARELTDDVEAALIFDEIQTGLGRTGRLWACDHAGVVPDILTTAKGMASGLPIGATLCAEWIAEGAASHGSTYAGSPVVAAAATATLETIVEDELPANAARIGDEIVERIEDADLPIREVRGQGLMIGIELRGRSGPLLRHLALEENILALPAGRSVIRLLPPLMLDSDHAEEIVAGLTAAFATIAEQ